MSIRNNLQLTFMFVYIYLLISYRNIVSFIVYLFNNWNEERERERGREGEKEREREEEWEKEREREIEREGERGLERLSPTCIEFGCEMFYDRIVGHKTTLSWMKKKFH